MKSIILRSVLIAGLSGGLILLNNACSEDFLEVPPQGDQLPEDYFSNNPDAAVGLVNAIYNKLLDWNISSFSWVGVSSITSDEADKGSDPGDTGTDKQELDQYTFNPSSLSFNEVWQGNYQGIARANQALTYLPELSIDEALRTRLIGEASFLRALFYFRLVRCFGGVPKIDRVPDVNNPDDLEMGRTRVPVEEIYAFIESDLNVAIENLPERNEGGLELGRASKGAAKALLAKVSMYQQKWEEVLRLTDEVIASNIYDLMDDYSHIWREIGENSEESIFEVQARGVIPEKGVAGYSEVQGVRGQWGWGFNTPSQVLSDAYEPGDVRREATLMARGEILWDGEQVNPAAPNAFYNQKAYVSRTQETWSGNNGQTNKNVRILRFAEVLLMNAEAANELGQTAQALASLNRVRERAGLGPVSSGGGDELRQLIWHERWVELAMEHDRIFDLRRQGRAGEVLRAAGKPFVDGKHELFPIPQNQIDLSGGVLTQNPGY